MSDAPEIMYVRGKGNGAMGRWHDATSLEETALITADSDNPMYRYIRADVARAERDAAVAQALEAAISLLCSAGVVGDAESDPLHEMLRALIPAPAGKEGA